MHRDGQAHGTVIVGGLLGTAASATVSSLQLRVLQKADGVGQSLASSLNIGDFSLGNALGAWVGGWGIARGPGIEALPRVAALLTAAGGQVAWLSVWLDRPIPTPSKGATAMAGAGTRLGRRA